MLFPVCEDIMGDLLLYGRSCETFVKKAEKIYDDKKFIALAMKNVLQCIWIIASEFFKFPWLLNF